MELRDLLPILVPGALIQLLIQAYYIKHAWENPYLPIRKKVGFIIAIAILNIVAAAVYLLTTRKKTTLAADELPVIMIDNQIRQGVFALLIVAYEIFTLRIIANNIGSDHYFLLIGLLAACFVIMLVHGLLVRQKDTFLYYTLPAVMLLMIIPVEYLDRTLHTPFVVLVIVAAIVNKLPLKDAQYYFAAALGMYAVALVGKANHIYGSAGSDDGISFIYVSLLVFVLVYAAFYSLNKQLLTNSQLETALQRLREQSLVLQEMSAVAERNRITGEIHDTVGHTLTSAIISIEAGEKLLEINDAAANEKFSLAKEQVIRGLQDIRSSVKTIASGNEMAFVQKLKMQINEIRHNTGLIIRDIVELQVELLPIQQHVLLQSIKECATNSLKHGNSTEADLLIGQHKNSVNLTFSDNGTGTNAVTLGFGLRQMLERVESIGGTMFVDSAAGEGFTVTITIPAGVKTGGV